MEEFELNEKGDFHVNWNGSIKFSNMSLNELIVALLSEFKSNLNQYDSIMQNDGKLIGNEKIVLTRSLGDLVQLFVFSRNYIQKHFAEGKYSNPKLNISMKNDTDFTLRGNLLHSELNGLTHYGEWQKKNLTSLIQNYTDEIKKSLEDKVITVEEGNRLCATIDQGILQILIAYYKLSYQNLLR
jgi:hypothetical protein